MKTHSTGYLYQFNNDPNRSGTGQNRERRMAGDR